MMKFVVLVVFIAVAAAQTDLDVDLGDLPMQNPDLFQGDILGYGPGDRNVIPNAQMRWPQATVPYVIDSSVASYENVIRKAMQRYSSYTCLRFIRRTTEMNWIRIFAGQGCYSYVGMVGGQQSLSLGRGCMFKGTIVHELSHAIGFFHEQNRSDRDHYLIIYWNNIQSGMESQFVLLKSHENPLLDTFDYNSVMLYGNTAFSKDGHSNTMIAKTGVKLYQIYDKQGLSTSDIIRVNTMYNCRGNHFLSLTTSKGDNLL